MGKEKNSKDHTNSIEYELTPQQDQFCYEYTIDYNGYKAAIRAKYSKKTAAQIASRLLRKVKVRERIEYYKKQSLLNAEITPEQVLNELKIMGFSDFADILKTNKGYITLQEFERLPPQVTRAIKSFEFDGKKVKIKFHSKEKSLELLGKYMSMFSENINIDGQLKTDNELVIKVVQVDGVGAQTEEAEEAEKK